MSISPPFLKELRQDYRQAPRGTKTKVVEHWAAVLECSTNKIYRALGPNNDRQRRQGTSSIENIEDYTKTVFQIKKRPPEELGEISTDQAVAIAVKSDLIPAGISVSTFNRHGRRLKLNKKKRRVQRYQAERPNQMHHIDASSSSALYVSKIRPDGEYILKLNKRPALNYKNKPTPVGLRLWIYALTDDYSGYSIARYVVAPGESRIDNLDFLQWAWGKNEDKPFFGLPEMLKSDKGPMMRGNATQELLERLGVEVDPSVPYAKDAHGKIERPWRTHWQRFEKPFYALPDWDDFEITVSDLNRQLSNYFLEYNNRPHRYEKNITREQAWRRISLHGGAVALPEDAIKTTADRIRRKVATDGCFRLDGEIYEVKGLHDAWVEVIRGVFDGKMIVQDNATGEKYEVEDFKPNPIGTFTAHKDTPHQKAKKAAQHLELTGESLYEESTANSKVTPIPTRIKEERGVENIIEINKYRSIDEALRDFTELSGCFLKDGTAEKEDIKQILIEAELSKSIVRSLASDYLKTTRCING